MDWVQLLVFTTPLALAALGELVYQKAGVINIGLEGVILFSAFSAMLASSASGSPAVGIAIGVLAGIILNAVSGLFAITLGADQVVVGTAINLFSIGLTGTLFRIRFGQTGRLFSVPMIGKWHGIDVVVLFSFSAVGIITFVLWHTAWGLAVRSAGEYPKATEAAGFSVVKLRYQAGICAGLFAGLGGAYLALGVVGSFAENMTSGRGFIAIAMVTFGRWRPVFVFLACLLIGFLESLQYVLQAGNSVVPFQMMIALPYVAALLVLVFAGKGTRAPAALGQPYAREH